MKNQDLKTDSTTGLLQLTALWCSY